MDTYQYSKKIPIITGIIFCACLIAAFIMPLDKAVYITCITTSGSIFGSSIIWYMKKSQVENSYKLKANLYKIATENRLKYVEESLKLQAKYKVTQQQIDDMEYRSPIDEFESEALSSLQQTIETHFQDADSPVQNSIQ